MCNQYVSAVLSILLWQFITLVRWENLDSVVAHVQAQVRWEWFIWNQYSSLTFLYFLVNLFRWSAWKISTLILTNWWLMFKVKQNFPDGDCQTDLEGFYLLQFEKLKMDLEPETWPHLAPLLNRLDLTISKVLDLLSNQIFCWFHSLSISFLFFASPFPCI